MVTTKQTFYPKSKHTLIELLEDFSDEVASKNSSLKQLPYEDWKKLKKCNPKSFTFNCCSSKDVADEPIFLTIKSKDTGESDICFHRNQNTKDFMDFSKSWFDATDRDTVTADIETSASEPPSFEKEYESKWYTWEKDTELHFDNLTNITSDCSTANVSYCTNYGTGIESINALPYSSKTDGSYAYGLYDLSVGSGSGILSNKIETIASIDMVQEKISDVIEDLVKTYDLKEKINIDTDRKETDTMNMFSKINFDFGPANTEAIRLSPFGMAIKTPNREWHTYDATNQKIVDVSDFSFNFGSTSMFYKMPVAPDAVAVGDVILHNARPVFVTGFVDEGNKSAGIVCIDTDANEQKTVLPVCNVFNFNFVTKIVSLFNMTGGAGNIFGTPTADQPFGNIFGMMMMSEMFKDNGKSNDNDFFKMMMMSQMFSGGANPFAQMFGSFNAIPAKSPVVTGGPMDA